MQKTSVQSSAVVRRANGVEKAEDKFIDPRPASKVIQP